MFLQDEGTDAAATPAAGGDAMATDDAAATPAAADGEVANDDTAGM